jgi:hypothetical protein
MSVTGISWNPPIQKANVQINNLRFPMAIFFHHLQGLFKDLKFGKQNTLSAQILNILINNFKIAG